MIARYWKRRIKANQNRIKSGIITCHPTSILVCVMLMWIKKEINFSEPLLLTKTLLCFIWALNKVLSYNIRLSGRRWVFRKDIFSWKLKSWVWVMMLHKMTFYWNVFLLFCSRVFVSEPEFMNYENCFHKHNDNISFISGYFDRLFQIYLNV